MGEEDIKPSETRARDSARGRKRPVSASLAAWAGLSPWLDWMLATPSIVRIGICLLLLAGLLLLDYWAGFEISLSVFHLAPVLLAGVTVSLWAGRAVALVSALAWGVLDLASGHLYSAAWVPVWNGAVRLAFFLIITELIEKLRQAHLREQDNARTDSLTGAANGRVFQERANQTIVQARRDGRPFTLTYIDLDRFKQVNDTYGHAEGDRLLRTVAALIEGQLRQNDLVARLGGDEFGVLMPDTGAEAARATLERTAAVIRAQVGERWGVGATLGAVTFLDAPPDYDTAVRLADDLMYRGKAEGRGRILQETWPPQAGPSIE